MKRLSIFLIFLIIVFSGCIGQDEIIVSTKDGVVITDFFFDYSTVYAKDTVGLHLEVQNVGGSEAELSKIQIYGVGFVDPERDWVIRSGDEIVSLSEKLYRPDPDIDLEGAKYYYKWGLRAPSSVTAETDYDFMVRVEYKYETTYSGTIRVISDNYLQSLSENERQKLFDTGGVFSSELTNGPLTVTPYSGRHFIVDSTAPQARIMRFEIENVGKGYPFITDAGEKLNYYIRIKQPMTGDVITGCNNNDPKIKLSKGKSHTISCVFEPPGTDKFTNKIDKPFQITFKYSYYVDGRTSITVNPSYEEGIVITTTSPTLTCADLGGDCIAKGICDADPGLECAAAPDCTVPNCCCVQKQLSS